MPTPDTTGLTVTASGDWWTLYDNGLLYIFCEGNMSNYSILSRPPWYSSRLSVLSVLIDDSTTSVGHSAFMNHTNLKSATISNSVCYVGISAFSSCSNLDSVLMPDTLSYIGNSAFGYCSKLESIAIPYGTTYVDTYAFNGCSKLKDVYFFGTQEEWNEIDIKSGNDKLTGATVHFSDSSQVETPVITSQPHDASYTIGDTPQPLFISASTTDGGTISYQWFSDASGKIPGATLQSYSPQTASDGIETYYCAAINTHSKNKAATKSNAATITVHSTPHTITVNGGTASAAEEASLNTVTITATVPTGKAFGYWTSEDVTFADATARTTTFVMPAKNVTINAVVVAVPVIATQPQNATYNLNDTASVLTAAATVSDGGTLSYKWYVGGSQVGASQSYTPSTNAKGRFFYKCTVTNTLNQATASADSRTAIIDVVEHSPSSALTGISVTTQPTKTTYAAGETFDPTGMVVTAAYSDNTTLIVNGYTTSPTTALTTNDTSITVSYTENNVTQSTIISITVTGTTPTPEPEPPTGTLTYIYYTGSDIFKLRVCAVINSLIDAVNAMQQQNGGE